jgi:hypothetical protein
MGLITPVEFILNPSVLAGRIKVCTSEWNRPERAILELRSLLLLSRETIYVLKDRKKVDDDVSRKKDDDSCRKDAREKDGVKCKLQCTNEIYLFFYQSRSTYDKNTNATQTSARPQQTAHITRSYTKK